MFVVLNVQGHHKAMSLTFVKSGTINKLMCFHSIFL